MGAQLQAAGVEEAGGATQSTKNKGYRTEITACVPRPSNCRRVVLGSWGRTSGKEPDACAASSTSAASRCPPPSGASAAAASAAGCSPAGANGRTDVRGMRRCTTACRRPPLRSVATRNAASPCGGRRLSITHACSHSARTACEPARRCCEVGEGGIRTGDAARRLVPTRGAVPCALQCSRGALPLGKLNHSCSRAHLLPGSCSLNSLHAVAACMPAGICANRHMGPLARAHLGSGGRQCVWMIVSKLVSG